MMGSFKVIDTTATSISELEKNNFAVFPNPANDFLTITSADNKIFSVTIFNSFGEKIYSAQTTTNLNVETVNFSSGLYFVQIIADKKSFTKKIIKK